MTGGNRRNVRDALDLRPGTKGTNVEILIPDEAGVLDERMEPARGITCTNPVRTYLDMSHAGERGREAAEHLRRRCLEWTLQDEQEAWGQGTKPQGGNGEATPG